MTSSVLSVELVSVAYERMNDWPAHWSVLMRTPVIVTRASVALELLLVDGDGGDGARLEVHLALEADAESGRVAFPVNGMPMPGVKLAPGLISTSSEMMPQPICSPASSDSAGQLGASAAGDLAR